MKKHLLTLIVISMITCVSAQIPAYLPANGLVAWYPFNGNANDESGNGNHGIVTGALLTPDRFGNMNAAYEFNGNSDYITVAGNSSLHNMVDSMSCSIWIYATPFIPVTETTVSKQNNLTGFGFNNTIYNNTNQYEFRVINASGSGSVLTFVPIITSSWHHIVSVISGSTRYIYCDGILNTTVPAMGFLYGANTAPLIIGAIMNNTGTFGNWYLGKIDDIGIWNRPLTQQEVTQIYNGTVQINEPLNPVEITVFPNPAQEALNILSYGNLIDAEYIITDLSGRTVLRGNLTSQHTTADISSLSEGSYYISINNTFKQSFTKVRK
jgi:hypothetical protein